MEADRARAAAGRPSDVSCAPRVGLALAARVISLR
jgi:hypothetical protein